MKKNIAIIMGGYSSEYDISIKSGHVVFENLDKEKYNAYRIIISRDDWHMLDKHGNKHPVNRHDFTVDLNSEKNHIRLCI